MSVFVQYGKVGKPIVYNTLPVASEDLKGVCGQVEDKIYICDGSNWDLFSNTTLKKLLDATRSANYLFQGYEGDSVDNLIAYDDTSEVVSLYSMFRACDKLTSVPLLNTKNATTAALLFSGCSRLITIPAFDFSKITNMSDFCSGCYALQSISLLNTSRVTLFNNAFNNCRSLISVPEFDTSNVTMFQNCFYNCNKLVTIPLLNTSKATDLSYMFFSCSSLEFIPLFDTSSAKNMNSMFQNCSKITIVPALNVSNATNLGYMFSNCSSLKSILMTGMKANFDIHWSTQFEESDLVTILNNLATVETTRILTMGATNLAKLTDEEKAIATNKGWTLA